jgi:hypothetical protein
MPLAIRPITAPRVMAIVGFAETIPLFVFVLVPPTIIMVCEHHTWPLNFGISFPTVAAGIARYESKSLGRAE